MSVDGTSGSAGLPLDPTRLDSDGDGFGVTWDTPAPRHKCCGVRETILERDGGSTAPGEGILQVGVHIASGDPWKTARDGVGVKITWLVQTFGANPDGSSDGLDPTYTSGTITVEVPDGTEDADVWGGTFSGPQGNPAGAPNFDYPHSYLFIDINADLEDAFPEYTNTCHGD